MTYKTKDANIYNEAKTFLFSQMENKVSKKDLESYLVCQSISHKEVELEYIYQSILESAQNANMKKTVIGKSINGVSTLRQVLFNFNPEKVLKKYSNNSEKLLDTIVQELNPKGRVRRSPNSLWPKYCRTILSTAKFLAQFSNSKSFFEWADSLNENKKTFASLPLIIEAEIFGIGFPLACDFLKEIGYENYGKPDVHINEIFHATGLIEKGENSYQILKAIIRVAESVNVTPYNVDKIFWLIGSGNFYKHENIGDKGHVGSMKKAFLKSIGKNAGT